MAMADRIRGAQKFVNANTNKEATRDSVISKVIEMLESEKSKVAEDIKAEAAEMNTYFEWCDDEQKDAGYEIKTATRKEEELNAKIADRTAGIAALDEEIHDLAAEITERNEEMDEANALRKKQEEDFKVNEAEQLGMVEELEHMQQELKRQMEAMTTPPPVPEEGAEEEALLQLHHGEKGKANSTKENHVTLDQIRAAMEKMVNSVWVDPQSKKALGQVGSMIQQSTGLGEDPPAAPAPAADPMATAQANGENNLAAFEMLKGKAEESLQRMRDDEVTEKHNHDLRIQALTQAIHLAEDKKEDATKDKTRLSEEKGAAEAELVKTGETKAAAEKYLSEVSSECDKASQDWEERQKGAKDEMAAINKAKEILAARVNVFVQARLHLRDPHQADARKVQSQEQKARQDLINHFRTLGSKMKSMAMLNLVSVASEEPMDQVKGLISDLIAKLEKEAAEAANLHAFCEEEKAKNKKAKAKKTATIEKLDARLDQATSRKEELEENVATLSGEIADMDAGQAEATKIRQEEHALNTKSIADFKEAADAVADATDALKDYYGDSSLVQIQSNTDSKHHAPPKLGGARSDAANTILSIMDTMQQEFQKTAAEFTSAEREAAKAHATLVQENRVSKAAKEAEIKGNGSEIKSLSVSIHNFNTDKKASQGELDTVLEYIEKLKPQCQGRKVSYAERKAKREAEIEGLKMPSRSLRKMECQSSSRCEPAFADTERLRCHTDSWK
jgi:hypothetical protein